MSVAANLLGALKNYLIAALCADKFVCVEMCGEANAGMLFLENYGDCLNLSKQIKNE